MSGVQSTFSCKDPRTTGGHQRTRRVVSGPCQPRGRQGTGKRMVVLTEVGLGRKMGATSIGIESTKSKRCLSSLSVSVPSRSPPVAPRPTQDMLAWGSPRGFIACVSPSPHRAALDWQKKRHGKHNEAQAVVRRNWGQHLFARSEGVPVGGAQRPSPAGSKQWLTRGHDRL